MKYLILLTLVSCSSTQYKRHNWATVKYTVREYYFPVKSVEPVKTVPSKPKPKKTVKKAKKVDCEKVFKQVNWCSR